MKTIFKGNRFRLTSGYKTTSRPDHGGIDLVGLDSTIVISPIEGTVITSTIIRDKSNLTWEWGNYVRIDDANGNQYYFCHLASRGVKAGQKVSVGTQIGIMGNTGYSFGAHTHFEIRNAKGVKQNPAFFLGIPNEEGEYNVSTEPDGWIKIPDGRWQYRQSGKLLKSKWVKDGKYWYYLGADSYMVTGMQKIGGKLYYLNPKRQYDIPTGACIITKSSGEIV